MSIAVVVIDDGRPDYLSQSVASLEHHLLLAPDHPNCEQAMTEVLLSAGYRFCFWGAMYDAPRVTHIGYEWGPGRHM